MSNLLLARRSRARDAFNGTALRQEWAKTDTENKLSVAGGTLVCAGGKATPAFNDPRISWAKPLQARAGLTFECEITFSSFGTSGVEFGFDATNPIGNVVRPGFYVTTTGQLAVSPAGGGQLNVPLALSLGTSYRFRFVLTNPGTIWLVSLDAGKTWVPVWVEATGSTGVIYAGLNNSSAAFTSAYLRVFQGSVPAPALSDAFAARTSPGRADTGQPWLTVTTKPLPAIAGDMRIQAGQTEAWLQGWSGVADGIWEADLHFGAALNTLKAGWIAFRHRDSQNFMDARFSYNAQTITIQRIANNVTSNVATLAAAGFALNTTYRMRVVAVGSVTKVYQDGVERLSVSEAFGQFYGLAALQLSDDLATPDIRLDNLRVWGTPARPLLVDTFDRPDNTLTLGRADTGQAYAPGSDTAVVPVMGIENGRARLISVAAGPTDRLAQAALPQGSFVASAPVRTILQNSGVAGIMLRWQDTANYAVARVAFAASAQQPILTKRLAGVSSTVASGSLSASAQDQDYLLTTVVLGNTVEGYINGLRYFTTTLADFPNSPAAGPYNSDSDRSRLDDLRYYPLGNGALVHDSFTRADSAVSLGATELPGVAFASLVGGTWGISSNQAYCLDITSTRWAGVPVLVQDVDVQCDMTRAANGVGLLVRGDSALNNYLSIEFNGTNCNVIERVGGAAPAFMSQPAYVWAAAATKTVRMRVFQGLMSVYVDGVFVASQAFTGHNTAADNLYGLRVTQVATTNRFDNFLVREVT